MVACDSVRSADVLHGVVDLHRVTRWAPPMRRCRLLSIALYQGADREKLLIEGAKKEGQVVFYNSHTWFKAVAQEFEKKYPFIKVAEWRADGADVMKRVIEENRAGRFSAMSSKAPRATSVVCVKTIFCKNTRRPSCAFLTTTWWPKENAASSIGPTARPISAWASTRPMSPLPTRRSGSTTCSTPRLKGKMSLAGGATSARWVGAVVESAGREFIEKLGRHDINVHKLSGAALANLVVTGEVPISPTIFDSNIFVAKRKGAPVEWLPVEPVIANVGYSGIVSNAPHPHAALLLIDYLHSKEGQQFIVKGGLKARRATMSSRWSTRSSRKFISKRNIPSTSTKRNYPSGKS